MTWLHRDTTGRGNSIDRAREQGSFGLTFVLDMGIGNGVFSLGIFGPCGVWLVSGILDFALAFESCILFLFLSIYPLSLVICLIYIFYPNMLFCCFATLFLSFAWSGLIVCLACLFLCRVEYHFVKIDFDPIMYDSCV